MDKQHIINEFDELASQYESNRLSGWYKAHAEWITKHLDANSTQVPITIMDIGCATGYLLKLFSAEQKVWGLDISSKMVDQAARNLAQSNTHILQCGDWEDIDSSISQRWPLEGFDLIICANTFHYFADPQKALQKMVENLKPDGIVMIMERDTSSSLLTRFWGLLHRVIIKDHVVFYSKAELTNMMEKTGLIVSKPPTTLKRWFWKGKMYTSLCLITAKKDIINDQQNLI